jgi:hypothetical protein
VDASTVTQLEKLTRIAVKGAVTVVYALTNFGFILFSPYVSMFPGRPRAQALQFSLVLGVPFLLAYFVISFFAVRKVRALAQQRLSASAAGAPQRSP